MIRTKFLNPQFISAIIASLLLTSCATIGSLAHNGLSPVFLHISTANIAGCDFYLDGKPETANYIEYSRSQVSENAYATTYVVTSLPAIMVDPHHQYHTFTIQKDGKKWNLLLKRDYKLGFLVLDTYLTYGIGNVIDVVTSNIYGFPELDLDRIMSGDYKNYIIYK